MSNFVEGTLSLGTLSRDGDLGFGLGWRGAGSQELLDDGKQFLGSDGRLDVEIGVGRVKDLRDIAGNYDDGNSAFDRDGEY